MLFAVSDPVLLAIIAFIAMAVKEYFDHMRDIAMHKNLGARSVHEE